MQKNNKKVKPSESGQPWGRKGGVREGRFSFSLNFFKSDGSS